MTGLDRRQVSAGLAAALLLGPRAPALGAARAKVVVVGGGPAGATVAGNLKRASEAIDVILVEPQSAYTTCFFSNYYIGGLRSFDSITHRYRGLERLGVDVAHDRVVAVDAGKKQVRLSGGKRQSYDRLVVAPGIDFKLGAIEGLDEAAFQLMPHAWKGGRQTRLLRRRLEAMEDGGVVVIAPPRNPYRCPPGPYERACTIASYLKAAKPKSKLIILDPKMAFSKQPVFEEAFAKYYKDIVELHLTNDIDDMAVARVVPRTGEVVTKSGFSVKAAVANIVPDQRAGDIAAVAGLTEGDWCPVKLENFRSARVDDVYVLGDSAVAAEMPKSAYAANNQAGVVAADILADLAGGAHPDAHFRNTCWSWLHADDAVKIGADYAPGDLNGKHELVPSASFVSKPGESAALRKDNYEESQAWYDTLVGQMFAEPVAAPKESHG